MTDIRPKGAAPKPSQANELEEMRPGCKLPFPQITGYWVNRLGAAVRTAVDRELRVFDLTRHQVGVLMHIDREGSPSASDLTRLLKVDSTAVTRMVDRLEEKGLVARSQDPDDGRRYRISITAKAKRLMPKIRAIAVKVERSFEEGIAEKDVLKFQEVLMKMLTNVGEEEGAMLVNDDG